MATKQKSETAHPQSDDRIIYIFAYLLTWLSGILVYITVGQKNKRVKFHAVQAIFLGIVMIVVSFIPIVGWIIAAFLWLYGLYIGFKAYEGTDISVPILGEYATKYSK